ncbi:MAG: hypothetical protein NTX03_13325 [Bacteroidetes bacterium]|nr:hypothetical protein [Bacteroidota bacterium]
MKSIKIFNHRKVSVTLWALRLVILSPFIFCFTSIYCQDFDKCKVDFFLLESQKSFDNLDTGKEFIILQENVPNYDFNDSFKKTPKEVENELNDKLRDNKDYNKNNLLAEDSLINHYSNLYDRIGITILWWEFVETASMDEIKQLQESIRDNKEMPIEFGRYVKEYSSSTFVTQEEFFMYVNFFQIEKSGERLDEETFGKLENTVIINQNFGGFEKALKRCNQIKKFPDIFMIKYGQKYRLSRKVIPAKKPIFAIQPKDSTKNIFRWNKVLYTFQIGIKPIFNLTEFINKPIVLNEVQGDPNLITPMFLKFIVDKRYKLQVINYIKEDCPSLEFRSNKWVSKTAKNSSTDIFYNKRKLNKINEFLTELKTKSVVIQSEGVEFINPKINEIVFNFNSITINLTSNGKEVKKIFKAEKDPNFIYNSSYPERQAKTIFDLPIYYTDCYNESNKEFSNLKLPKDFLTEPSLKTLLSHSLSSNPDWSNYYAVNRIILTEQSSWRIQTNKYTGLQEKRFILADAYVTSKQTGK